MHPYMDPLISCCIGCCITLQLLLCKLRLPMSFVHNKTVYYSNTLCATCKLTTPENTITCHNTLCLSPQNFALSIVFSFSWESKRPQEKLKTMLLQNFGVTNKEYYGMLWYFLEWSILYCS